MTDRTRQLDELIERMIAEYVERNGILVPRRFS